MVNQMLLNHQLRQPLPQPQVQPQVQHQVQHQVRVRDKSSCGKKGKKVVQIKYMNNINIQQIKSFFSLPKIIFLGLGLVLLVELIYAFRVLTLPVSSKKTEPVAVVQPQKAGMILLKAPKILYSVKDTIPVTINIDTNSRAIDGIDVIIKYDPKILEATAGSVIKGNLFDEYPVRTVDVAKGLIAVSGISSFQNGFKGLGKFAVIDFRAKAVGKTKVAIDFLGKGSTIDSNLVEVSTSKDILEQVENLELVVQ